MGFEDVLRRRIGPMRELMSWGGRSRKAPRRDLDRAWFRRAVGLDVRVRPDEAWSEIEVASPRTGAWQGMSRDMLRTLLGRTTWARDVPDAEALIQRELLYYANGDEPPRARLTGESGVLGKGGRIARRASMWATPAVETATEIAPMPFMPRGRDLVGAQLVGLRLASRERGHEVLTASVTGEAKTGAALRRLLPLLDGTRTQAEILAAFPAIERDRTAKLLALLDDLTALTAEPVVKMAHASRARVTWLGHAAVLVETGGLAILVDPLFFAPSEPSEPHLSAPRFDPRTLPKIDLVLITHGDNDHLNPTSLLHLPPSTPVVIPKVGLVPEPWQVDLRGVLGCVGFDRVVELDTWDTLDVGPARITAVPFDGEDWELELPKATWLVESPELTTYLAADSLPEPETLAWLAERRIDFAFLGVSGCEEAMAAPRELGYGDFYEPWIPEERRMEWARHTAGPRESAQVAGVVRPRFAFGYAAGGTSYIKTAYSDTGDHAGLAALLQGGATQPVTLEVGVPFEISAGDEGTTPPR